MVVGSVYVAIVLEGLSDARGRHADAVDALRILRVELGQDRGEVGRVDAGPQLARARFVDRIAPDLDRKTPAVLRTFARNYSA